jgi:hypothetical protein
MTTEIKFSTIHTALTAINTKTDYVSGWIRNSVPMPKKGEDVKAYRMRGREVLAALIVAGVSAKVAEEYIDPAEGDKPALIKTNPETRNAKTLRSLFYRIVNERFEIDKREPSEIDKLLNLAAKEIVKRGLSTEQVRAWVNMMPSNVA